ncbi:hypothetical protein NOJ05_28235 [Neorhizobium galegae]|uniref:hypothetical protein n=1 Tax=Neorhizobium galegae TaxID=399 RepID=UPI000621A921|nr:hypothetical protein [Neorhizobium galegae]MCQ1781113.1 hypothetical protein [Neorhizobium galegae]MCQ1797710.1 hypothetical protein [Neorhizobium galegae]CDZ30980.1 Hypothetical protein NGAL_HAMBI490_58530 [Neorhizobium galegae bv. officinalis]
MAKERNFGKLVAHHGPMLLFAILTLTGIVFIWTAKLWELHIGLVTAVPISIMLAYLLISLIANGMRLHNEQAGDNLYYMGFLFTLSSLGVSLYRFVGDASIDEIVRNFGIAVTSTICGIAFRILFNQMRRDPIDIERSVRHELAEMTRRVRTELDSSAREFSSYRRSSSQMLLEGFEEIARQAEQTGAAVQKAIEILSTESIKPIREASEKLATLSQQNLALFEERSSKLNSVAEEATAKVNAATMQMSQLVEGLGKAIEGMSGKIDGMQSPDEVLRFQLQPAVDAIHDVAKLQAKQSEDTAALLKQQVEKTAEALSPLNDLPKRLAEAIEPLKALAQLSLRPSPVAPSAERTASEPAWPERFAELPISTRDAIRVTTMDIPQPTLFASDRIDLPPEIKTGDGPLQAEIRVSPTIITGARNGEDEARPPISGHPLAATDDGLTKKSWFKRWQ